MTILRAAQTMAYGNLCFEYESRCCLSRDYDFHEGIPFSHDPELYFSEEAAPLRQVNSQAVVDPEFYQANRKEINRAYQTIANTGNLLIGMEVTTRSAVDLTLSLRKLFGFKVAIQPSYQSHLVYPETKKPISVRLDIYKSPNKITIAGYSAQALRLQDPF